MISLQLLSELCFTENFSIASNKEVGRVFLEFPSELKLPEKAVINFPSLLKGLWHEI